MSDIVERLQELAEYVQQQPPVQYEQVAAMTMCEAADELVRLNAEIVRLREALKEITDAVGSYETAKDKMLAGSRIAGAWHKASAILAEKKEK